MVSEMLVQRGIFRKFSTSKPLEDQFRLQTEGKIVTRLKLALFINPCKGRKNIHLIIKDMQIQLLAGKPFL
jgi:hypothetical protein